jgi:SAM-dependent methyltransferase
MSYDYEKFWSVRGLTQADSFTQKKQDQIRAILSKINYNNVIELGCGDGQLSKMIKEKSCYLIGVDISESRLERNEFIDSKINADITRLELPQTDLIICSHFLLHIKPEDIKQLILKCIKSAKTVIFIEPNPLKDLGEWEYYNFKHNYQEILQELNKQYQLIQLDDIMGVFVID